MDISPLLRGLVLGFAIAMPVGPIGVLCIRRTLAFGRLAGLFTGLGAATADGIYGGVAAFGLSAVTSFLTTEQAWIRLVGAFFLAVLGARALFSAPPGSPASVARMSLRSAWGSTVLLTLSNPATIISFAAAFAALGGSARSGRTVGAALMTAGVACGSALWWLVLSSGVSALRQRLTTRALAWSSRVSGVILIAFALAACVSLAL